MLDWLKDLVSPIRIDDSRFGTIRYLRDARFWEGKARFAPTGSEVEVLIPGGPRGPTSEQYVFYDHLQARYEALWPDLRERLAAEALRVQVDTRDFALVCIDLPDPAAAQSPAEWSLGYETSPPSSWYFTVEMDGWTPAEVVTDS
jgi:hypothetical protein